MAQIFISYSSQDFDFVERLARDLEAHGHDVWLDRWKITGREPYWDEIQAGIESCTHFLFVISPDSIKRDCAARKELGHAAGLKPLRTMIPVVARATPYKKLPIHISPGVVQIHDFTRLGYDDGFKKVLVALGASAPPTVPPVTPPSRRSYVMAGALVAVLIVIVAVILVLSGVLSGDENDDSPTESLTAAAESTEVATDTPEPQPTTTEELAPPPPPTLPANSPVPDSGAGALTMQRSADTVAVCANEAIDLSALKIQFGSTEWYILGDDFPASATTQAGQCWCLQQKNPIFPVPEVCTDANIAVYDRTYDWRNAAVSLTLDGAPVGMCGAQADSREIYECVLD